MGKLISICAVGLTIVLAGFSYSGTPITTNKTNELTIVDNESLTLKVESDDDFRFFLKAEFDEAEQEIKFITKEPTTQIRIYNQIDAMVYLLPIGSDRVRIGKNLFEKGDYKFIFDIEGDRRMYTSNLTVH
jgi:hypothetical protein